MSSSREITDTETLSGLSSGLNGLIVSQLWSESVESVSGPGGLACLVPLLGFFAEGHYHYHHGALTSLSPDIRPDLTFYKRLYHRAKSKYDSQISIYLVRWGKLFFSVFLVEELQLNSTIVLFNDVLCGRRVRAEFIKTSNGDNNDDADDDDEAA